MGLQKLRLQNRCALNNMSLLPEISNDSRDMFDGIKGFNVSQLSTGLVIETAPRVCTA